MELQKQLLAYIPMNEQEAEDRAVMLRCLEKHADLYTRDNPVCHLTASAWIVNPERTKVLLAYHNIYRSWAWLGGHADGERDLLGVALREAREESGLRNVRAVKKDIYSVEVLTVDGHVKRGRYVSSHLHLNVTYLLEADERENLACKPDENSGVGWFGLEEALEACTEPWIRKNIYAKLNEKLRLL